MYRFSDFYRIVQMTHLRGADVLILAIALVNAVYPNTPDSCMRMDTGSSSSKSKKHRR